MILNMGQNNILHRNIRFYKWKMIMMMSMNMHQRQDIPCVRKIKLHLMYLVLEEINTKSGKYITTQTFMNHNTLKTKR